LRAGEATVTIVRSLSVSTQMKSSLLSAWALLLALAVSLAISPETGVRNSSSEDRNSDGQADVWQFYDEDGELVRVLHDRNFDGYVDAREVIAGHRMVSRALDRNVDHQSEPGFTGGVAAEPDVTFSVAPQPFLLPRAVYVGDQPLENRAPETPESSSAFRSSASPSGRAPPSAR
jgi:hypothetical protein